MCLTLTKLVTWSAVHGMLMRANTPKIFIAFHSYMRGIWFVWQVGGRSCIPQVRNLRCSHFRPTVTFEFRVLKITQPVTNTYQKNSRFAMFSIYSLLKKKKKIMLFKRFC